MIGKYRVGKLLDYGFACTVYEVLGQNAVAELLWNDGHEDNQWSSRFRREVELWSRPKHPNIVPLIDSGIDPGDPERNVGVQKYAALDGAFAIYPGRPNQPYYIRPKLSGQCILAGTETPVPEAMGVIRRSLVLFATPKTRRLARTGSNSGSEKSSHRLPDASLVGL